MFPSASHRTPRHTTGHVRARIARVVLLGLLGPFAICVTAAAQTPPLPHASPSPAPKTVAVLAAAGDQFQYVRRKPPSGSRIDPFIRRWITLPDNALNKMVLSGMTRALSGQYPDAALTLLMLTPTAEDRAVLPQARETHTMQRGMDYLQPLPERATWDQIVVVTPKWFFDEHKGMASKLSGIGLFVQPIATRVNEFADEALLEDEVRDITPEEYKQPRASRYVAPFFFMQMTVLDAKTLAVLRREERFDFRKIINSDSTALDIEKSFTTQQLTSEIISFVERAARRMVVDREGSIDIGPVRTVPAPSPGN